MPSSSARRIAAIESAITLFAPAKLPRAAHSPRAEPYRRDHQIRVTQFSRVVFFAQTLHAVCPLAR